MSLHEHFLQARFLLCIHILLLFCFSVTSPLKQSFFAAISASDQSWLWPTQTRSSFCRCLGVVVLENLILTLDVAYPKAFLLQVFGLPRRPAKHQNTLCSLPSVLKLCHHCPIKNSPVQPLSQHRIKCLNLISILKGSRRLIN